MATIKDFYVKQGAQASTTLIAGAGKTNQLTIDGGVSGSPGVVSLTASGSDPNISVNIITKGSGGLTVNGNPITATPGGSNGQVQYNNNGVFGGYSVTGTAGNVVLSQAPTVVGGSFTALTSLAIRSSGSGAFDIAIVNTENLTTSSKTLTLTLNNANRVLNFGGDLTFGGAFTTSATNAVTLTTTGATNVTLPTTGTLATLAGNETLSSKTLSQPAINLPAYSVTSAVTAGTNAQGQGALTTDYNIVTTTGNNPSGVTLPTTAAGRLIVVINKGTNPIKVYPASGSSIDGLAANAAVDLPVGGVLEFRAATANQWYSSDNLVSGNGLLSLAGNLSTAGAFASTFTFTGATTVTFPTSGTLATTTGNITGSAGSVANALTINNGGTGAASGSTFNGSAALTISYNTVGAPSTSGTNATGTWGISISGTAAIATAATITNDNATNATFYPTFVSANTGNLGLTVNSTKLSFNPSTGNLSSTSFTGSLTGNASTATKVNNAVTFNNSNTGAASGTTFDGSSAITVSANTLGALPLAGGTLTGALTLAADPTQALHAATKQYVDATASSLDIKASARAASTAALTVTYANGASGVGATLTNAGAQAAFALDGVTLNANDRVLVKNQASAFQNGLYIVTTVGSGASNWVLTRATDADTAAEVTPGLFTFIEEGTTLGGTGWVLTSTGATTVGTTNLPFTQFSSAGIATAGNGLVQSGNVFHFASASNYTTGALFYASGSTTVGQLADAAVGNVLLSGGASTVPAFGKVNLDTTGTAHVTGTLQVGSGGSGATSLTGYLKGNGTSAFTASSTIPGSDVNGNITGNAANVTGIVATANGGTGANLTLTQYGVIVASTTTAMTSTAVGTAGQALIANSGATPTFQTLTLANIPDAWVKRSVRVATTTTLTVTARSTTTLTIGGTALTIDSVALANNDRVLVKDSTVGVAGVGANDNGIYSVSGIGTAVVLTRVADMDASNEAAEASTAIDAGTVNAGKVFMTNFKSTDTLGTTAMNWYENYNSSYSATTSTANTLVLRDGSGNFSAGTITAALNGNSTSASAVATTDDTSTAATYFVAFTTASSGNNALKVSSTKLTYNPSTGALGATSFVGNLTGTATTATNATNIAITNDDTTNASMDLVWVTTNTGNLPAKTSSGKLTFNPSTGTITTTNFAGTATNATNVAVTDDTSSSSTMYPTFVSATSGNNGAKTSSTKLTYQPSSGTLTVPIVSATTSVSTTTVALGNAGLTTGTLTVSSSVSTATLETVAVANMRSARYTVSIVSNKATPEYEIVDVLVVQNGTTPFVTSFGNVFTGTFTLGQFDAAITGGNLTVTWAPNDTSVGSVLKWTRQSFV